MTEEKKQNLRKIKSREYLKNSFWHLLAKKDYVRITIKDISEDSGLNRKTFYRNFENMEELMLASFADLFAELFLPYAHLRENTSISPDLFARCTGQYIIYIKKEQIRFQLIFQNHLEGFAQVIWKDMFAATAPDYSVFGSPNAPTPVNTSTLDLYTSYAAFATWGNLEWVLRHINLPSEILLDRTMDACSAYLHKYYVSYQIGRRFSELPDN